MAVYMIQGTYTAESWATMAQHPQDRSKPVSELVQKLGRQLISTYFCFGEYDVVVLTEMPDDSAALATSMAAVTPGHLKAIKTTNIRGVGLPARCALRSRSLCSRVCP